MAIVAAVTSTIEFAGTTAALAVFASVACAAPSVRPTEDAAARTFYTVTAEIALSRHELRVAALQYGAAAQTVDAAARPVSEAQLSLLRRAAEVAAATLQPSVAAAVTARWIRVAPDSCEAHRAAGRAELHLYRIEEAAADYRVALARSPDGAEAGMRELGTEIAAADDVFGARQLADRLAAYFPASAAAARVQGFAALRADDPKAAVRALEAARQAEAPGERRREIEEALWRARILSGDVDAPIEEARTRMQTDPSLENRLEYALLLLAARREAAALEELRGLSTDSEAAPVALRLLGLIEFQDGHDEAASRYFTQLLGLGRFTDDALYYLAVITERRGDAERALPLYAQVQSGENAMSAMLRAANLLRRQGAGGAADQLLDRLAQDQPEQAPEILAARARSIADGGDPAGALALLEDAIEEYPDNVGLRYAQASMLEERGRVSAAIDVLKRVLKARPDDPGAQNALGFTLADHDLKLARARSLIERAHLAAPNNAAILDSLGWVLYRQGRGQAALPYLTTAYADDRGGDIAAHLGEVLWRAGRHADAEHIWSEARAVDPDNRLLKATRARLHAGS